MERRSDLGKLYDRDWNVIERKQCYNRKEGLPNTGLFCTRTRRGSLMDSRRYSDTISPRAFDPLSNHTEILSWNDSDSPPPRMKRHVAISMNGGSEKSQNPAAQRYYRRSGVSRQEVRQGSAAMPRW